MVNGSPSVAELSSQLARVTSERDEFKKLYELMREENERLRRGLLGQKAERRPADAAQLTLSLLAMLLGEKKPEPAPEKEKVKEHERRKPRGRQTPPEALPRVDIELVPLEVQRLGLNQFVRIGEESSEVIERRQASAVVVRTVRPKFVRKDNVSMALSSTDASESRASTTPPQAPDAAATVATPEPSPISTPVPTVSASTADSAVPASVGDAELAPVVTHHLAGGDVPSGRGNDTPVASVGLETSLSVVDNGAHAALVGGVPKRKVIVVKTNNPPGSRILCAPPLALPIERALAGPGMLADTVVRRWQDHLPLNRLEGIYAREGLDLAKGTICGWHRALGDLCKPLVDAMHADALTQPILLTDATGVLVWQKEKCHSGHFWVLVAPGLHVLFRYSRNHDSAAVKSNLDGYRGYLVADAHAVYDFLYADKKVVEVGCWAHLRRYWFKAAVSDPGRSTMAMGMIGALFKLEKAWKGLSADERKAKRGEHSKPLVDDFFAWVEQQWLTVLPDTPAHDALRYARNHKEAFCRFLEDGRLPLHNNMSELQLRREAVGRKAWLFVGSDDAAEDNTTFVSLLASCALHGLEPWAYLLDLFCILPGWPHKRVLELAPAYWRKTAASPEVKALLEGNVMRRVALGLDPVPPPT